MSQEINLLPARAPRTAFRASSAEGAAIGVGIAAVVGIALGLYESHLLAGAQREAQAVERAMKDARAAQEKAIAERAARKPDGAPDAKLAELQSQLLAREQVLDALTSGAAGAPAGFSQYMLALSRQSVAGVWLTAFDFAAGAAEITLTGRALTPQLVPEYLQRLTQEAPFQGRRFASMAITRAARAPEGGAKDAHVPPSYIEFEISSEALPRAAAPAAGALPAPPIKPARPPATAATPPAVKPEAEK